MLSGGADGGIAMWDLEAAEESRRRGMGVQSRHTPLGSVVRYVDAICCLELAIPQRALTLSSTPQNRQHPQIRHHDPHLLPLRLPGFPIFLLRPHPETLRLDLAHPFRLLRPLLRRLFTRSIPNRFPPPRRLRNTAPRRAASRSAVWRGNTLARWARRRGDSDGGVESER